MKRILLVLPFVLAACDSGLTGPPKILAPTVASLSVSSATCELANGEFVSYGFDEFGYNRCARIFNGTYSSWCEERGAAPDCMGIYSSDQLVMKWNAEWDRGNAEGWSDPDGYSAWLNNEANGKKPDGSGAVWHYKYQWVGPCTDGAKLPDGGYCIWGQFEVLMDQGSDPNLFPGHQWFARAIPNGYGN